MTTETTFGEVKSLDELQCLLIERGFRKYFNGDQRIAQEGEPHFYVADTGTHIGICTNHRQWDDVGLIAIGFVEEDGSITRWSIHDLNYETIGGAEANGNEIQFCIVDSFYLGYLLECFRQENKWRSKL